MDASDRESNDLEEPLVGKSDAKRGGVSQGSAHSLQHIARAASDDEVEAGYGHLSDVGVSERAHGHAGLQNAEATYHAFRAGVGMGVTMSDVEDGGLPQGVFIDPPPNNNARIIADTTLRRRRNYKVVKRQRRGMYALSPQQCYARTWGQPPCAP